MTLSPSSSCLYYYVLSIALLLLTNVAAQQYNCRTGCSLDANNMGPPVCGEDYLTYLNECLAVCQNVPVLHFGPCESSIAESELSTDSEIITLEIMTRFISRGYRFVAKTTKFSNRPDEENFDSRSTSSLFREENARAIESNMEPYYVLFTPEGYEYAYRGESVRSYKGPTTPYTGIAEHRRDLAVIGVDTRRVVTDTKAFPFRTIGEADFGNSEGGCTLTMISRNAALTAGHCVYSVKNKAPIPMSRIAPGRYRDSSGRTVAPYGTWNVETVQTFGEFISNGNFLFDLAVVTFKPTTRSDMQNCAFVYPGDVVGFVAIDRPRTSNGRVNDNRLSLATITGYPADFPDGVMATSGTCSPAWESDHPQFAYHYCDTFNGQSGSAVLTNANVAIGAHAYGFYDGNNVGQFNGAVMMSGQLYDSVYEWAGLAHDQTACEPVTGPQPSANCVCRDMQERRVFQMICFIFNRQTCFGDN